MSQEAGAFAGGAGCLGCQPPAGVGGVGALEPGPRRALHRIVAAHTYTGDPRALVLALKYGCRPVAARALAHDLADAVEQAGIPGDLVVPVPLAPRRYRTRGFNQAGLVARAVARQLGLPVARRALRRIRETPPLAAASRVGRARLVQGAFMARSAVVKGRCILLIDDVLTTGSTAAMCARALRRAGAASVSVAVCCRGR